MTQPQNPALISPPPSGHISGPPPSFNLHPPATGGSTGSTGSGGTSKPVDPATQGALDLLKQTLESWGLGSLYTAAAGYLQQGYTSDEITLRLQNTDEYKQRFAGNELRKAKGLPVLSPAEYLGIEEQYRQVMSQYGLPAGFYDSHDDFNKFIGGDVSPTELSQRAQIASQQYIQAPQEFREYWQQFGLTPGQAIASILDPNHESLADLQHQANAVNIGGSALQQGITVSSARAMQLASNNVTLDQARQAYRDIAEYGSSLQASGARFGQQVTQDDQENAYLLNDGQATRKLHLIGSEEHAQFAGSGGSDQNTGDAGSNY